MKQLASLIGFGLWGAEPPVELLPASADEWQRLFDLSRRQAVTALLYDAILKLPKEHRPPRQVLFHFTSITQTIGHDNRRRADALAHFASLLQGELSLPTVVVKGSSLARLYPRPELRECGDNDLYTGTDTERIGALMETRGIAVDRKVNAIAISTSPSVAEPSPTPGPSKLNPAFEPLDPEWFKPFE